MDKQMPENMIPKRLMTDLDMNGNTIHEGKVNIPKEGRDITNKEYVDDGDTFNTTKAKKYDSAMVDVGGIKKGDSLKDKKLKDVIDKLVYPRVLPEYKEAVMDIHNEPMRILAGIPVVVTTIVDITKNDRPAFVSRNITASVREIGDNPEPTPTNTTITESGKNNIIKFPRCVVDTGGKVKLIHQVILSACETKKDSYGNNYPLYPYDRQLVLEKELKYIPMLPLMYRIEDAEFENTDISASDPMTQWDDVVRFMKPVSSIADYRLGVNETTVRLDVPNDAIKHIQLYVPNTLLRLKFNGDDITGVVRKAQTLNVIKYGDVSVPYTGVEFYTGDIKLSSLSVLEVTYESDDLFYEQRNVVVPVKQLVERGHIVVDDNNVQYPGMSKIQYTNTEVENFATEDKTVVKIHPVDSPVDGGYYDE